MKSSVLLCAAVLVPLAVGLAQERVSEYRCYEGPPASAQQCRGGVPAYATIVDGQPQVRIIQHGDVRQPVLCYEVLKTWIDPKRGCIAYCRIARHCGST